MAPKSGLWKVDDVLLNTDGCFISASPEFRCHHGSTWSFQPHHKICLPSPKKKHLQIPAITLCFRGRDHHPCASITAVEFCSGFLTKPRTDLNTSKTGITCTLFRLHWVPVKSQITYKTLLLTDKALNNLAPLSLADRIHPNTQSQMLRSSGTGLLNVPYSNLCTFADRGFCLSPLTCK